MKLVAFDPFKHLDYARKMLTVPISCMTKGIVALDKKGIPQGIVLLDNWAENSVMGHVAISHPMAMRQLPYEALDYVFNTCNKGMFLGIIAADNEKSWRFNTHLGFKEIYRIKDGYAKGVDYCVMQLLKEDCKHISKIKEVA